MRSFRLLLMAWLGLALTGLAQTSPPTSYTLTVHLTETGSGAPIPFVSGYLKLGRAGNTANEQGLLSVPMKQWPDTLLLSEVGFLPVALPLVGPPSGVVEVNMQAVTGQLAEVTVTGYRDPGKALMKQVIAHKRQNDPQRIARWTRNNYLRTEVDIENLTAGQKRSLLNTMVRVYQQYEHDSSTHTALPIFFREQYRKEYHTRSPQNDAAYLVSEQNLGLTTDGLGPKLDRFNVPINPYDGVISILKTSFVGPVSDLGLSFYTVDIPDTLIDNGKYRYRLRFRPNHANDNAFEGTFLIDGDSYAIQEAMLQTSPGANLNFVKSLIIRQTFLPIDDTDKGIAWVVTQNKLEYAFENGLGLLGLPTRIDSTNRTVSIHSTSVYGNYRINPTDITAINYALAEQAQPAPPPFTDTYRLSPLTIRERAIYQAVDSLKNNRQFRHTTRMAAFIASGYWDVKDKFRFGPFSSLLSSNLTEGLRIRTSVWTMRSFDEHICLWGYAAYGTRDKRFKGSFGIKYVPNRAPYRKYELLLKNDYDALGENDDQLDDDNGSSQTDSGVSEFSETGQIFPRARPKPYLVHENVLSVWLDDPHVSVQLCPFRRYRQRNGLVGGTAAHAVQFGSGPHGSVCPQRTDNHSELRQTALIYPFSGLAIFGGGGRSPVWQYVFRLLEIQC
jgi:hypothetical protein